MTGTKATKAAKPKPPPPFMEFESDRDYIEAIKPKPEDLLGFTQDEHGWYTCDYKGYQIVLFPCLWERGWSGVLRGDHITVNANKAGTFKTMVKHLKKIAERHLW